MGRYTLSQFLQNHLVQKRDMFQNRGVKIFQKNESDLPLMAFNDPFACFEIENEEDETDCTN